MANNLIYLDHHATTPVDPRVLRAMLPYFSEKFGNAASVLHASGWEAASAVEEARRRAARLIGAEPREIIFTSGATESNNLAIKGVAAALNMKAGHLITTAIEHKSVLDPAKRLALSGFRVTVLPVRKDGRVDPAEVRKALTPRTFLISVMMANNETGTLQPVHEIGAIAARAGVLFHCDASQAVGRVPVDVDRLQADLLSFTAHKFYGPKGVGALFVRKRKKTIPLIPLLDGGGHETGLRSGTLNVSGIVGLGAACEIAGREMKKEAVRVSALRDRLMGRILSGVPDAVVNGSLSHRLPNNLNLSFPGVEATSLFKRLPRLAFSTGSACTSANLEPSYVLKALGVSEALRRSSVRLGLGRYNTPAEIDEAAREIVHAVREIRGK